MEKQLEHGLAQAGLVMSVQQQQQLLDYVRLLHKWNKAYNLTSVRHPDDMVVKHILDSLVVSPYLEGQQFIDVGTGPGLPGIPLAIANPDKQFTLLDSLGKRIRFIRQVLHELGLTNVTPVQSRVEDFTPDHGFDAVLSRAFASMSDMVSWCHHLPHEQGYFYALKGQVDQQEIDALPADCSVTDIKALKVPGLEGARHLVILRAKSNE